MVWHVFVISAHANATGIYTHAYRLSTCMCARTDTHTHACSPFGSHVAEKVLVRLGQQHDSMGQEAYDTLTKVTNV